MFFFQDCRCTMCTIISRAICILFVCCCIFFASFADLSSYFSTGFRLTELQKSQGVWLLIQNIWVGKVNSHCWILKHNDTYWVVFRLLAQHHSVDRNAFQKWKEIKGDPRSVVQLCLSIPLWEVLWYTEIAPLFQRSGCCPLNIGIPIWCNRVPQSTFCGDMLMWQELYITLAQWCQK